MASIFSTLLQGLTNLVKWWITILPWEAGLRLKWGKHVTVLGPGVHLRVPLVHTTFKKCTRMRRLDMAVQTLTTLDGTTITLGATIGYNVEDIQRLYETLYHAEGTLGNLAQGCIAEYVTRHGRSECSPQRISDAVNHVLNFKQYGLGEALVTITDFAIVRTYRLIQDSRWAMSNHDLNTVTPSTATS